MSEKHWDALKAGIGMDQEGDAVYPPAFALKLMQEHLEIAPLRFADEDHGWLFWMRPQSGKVIRGMRTLKEALENYDAEVGLRMQAEARVRELEELLAQRPLERPVIAKEPCAAPVERAKPVREARAGTNGEEYYRRKVSGETWGQIGSGSLNAAKKWALANGATWPIK